MEPVTPSVDNDVRELEMKYIKSAIILGFVAIISTACAGVAKLERTQFLETIMVDGVSYDIHSAHEVDAELGNSRKVKVLVPKGEKPTIENKIASCAGYTSDPDCLMLFKNAAKEHHNQAKEETDSSH